MLILGRFFDGWYAPPEVTGQEDFVQESTNEKIRFEPSPQITCNNKPSYITHCGGKQDKPCLFNLKNDPCEYYDLSKQHPDIYKMMLDRLEDYRRKMTPSRRTTYTDPNADPKLHRGQWISWRDVEDEKTSYGLHWFFKRSFSFTCPSKAVVF